MPRYLSLAALLLLPALAPAQPKKPVPETPVSADPLLTVTLFASAPDIVQPIALDFDAKGRLLVVESHTHFRPAKYDGPKFDRVRMLEDTDGDGKADKFTTFYEGTTATMDLAVHPDGSVYVATRNEIIRLRDTKGTGTADEKTRIVFLDTKGNYPHNGLAGLSFDSRGDLNFGIGENLGADYKLIGSDGLTLTGGGEGGNVYHCTADGKKLRRVATGFWNPFGSCRDIYGRLFVVDNDPDASPPCRMLHIVEGGDYGFQFRYGRQGRHPFQAWNGELPGTLPYVTGTGESPCEVISYESDGLPSDYLGNLLVPAWADHRLERYVTRPNGASVAADRKPFIQGGKDFYPSGLTVAPDGSLFASDWGSRSYELHGKGAVWHVSMRNRTPADRPTVPAKAVESSDRRLREKAAKQLTADEPGRAILRRMIHGDDVRLRAVALTALADTADAKADFTRVLRSENAAPELREMAVRGLVARGADVSAFLNEKQPAAVRAEALAGRGEVPLIKLLGDPDPFLRHAAMLRATRTPAALKQIEIGSVADAKQRAGLLLAYRTAGETTGLERFLIDPDPDVRFMAAKWVSDEKLVAFRPQIVEMLKDPKLDPRAVVAYTTTLARLDDKPVNDDALAGYFLERLADKDATVSTKLMALRSIPAAHKGLRTEQLTDMLKHSDPAARIEGLRALKDRGDAKAAPAVLEVAKRDHEPGNVRAQAVLTLAALNEKPETFLALTADRVAAVGEEAGRALVGVKLTADQQMAVAIGLKGKNGPDIAARLQGKSPHANRPEAKNIAAWLKLLDGPADAEAGRRVFENPKLAGCSKCHQVEGRGANVGPELSLIGRTEPHWIMESILQPSAVVAPHYQAWKIQTTDDRTLNGLLVGTHLDESVYLDEKGNRFKVTANEVADVKPSKVSIMPEGLLDGLSDQEVRDLLAYLKARK